MSSTIGTFDLGPDGKTILLYLVSQKNQREFKPSDFNLLQPMVFIKTDAATGLTTNTAVKLVRNSSTGTKDSRLIFYNRIDAQQLGALAFDMPPNSVASDLLPLINESFGFDIQPTEIDFPDAILDDLVTFSLNFNSSSIIFKGTSIVELNPVVVIPDVPTPDELYFRDDYGQLETNIFEAGFGFGVGGRLYDLEPFLNYQLEFLITYNNTDINQIVTENAGTTLTSVQSDNNGQIPFLLGTQLSVPLSSEPGSQFSIFVKISLANDDQTFTFVRDSAVIIGNVLIVDQPLFYIIENSTNVQTTNRNIATLNQEPVFFGGYIPNFNADTGPYAIKMFINRIGSDELFQFAEATNIFTDDFLGIDLLNGNAQTALQEFNSNTVFQFINDRSDIGVTQFVITVVFYDNLNNFNTSPNTVTLEITKTTASNLVGKNLYTWGATQA
jgi:hypothetical protein